MSGGSVSANSTNSLATVPVGTVCHGIKDKTRTGPGRGAGIARARRGRGRQHFGGCGFCGEVRKGRLVRREAAQSKTSLCLNGGHRLEPCEEGLPSHFWDD